MRVLASPGYRRLWAARTVSQCGDVAQFTAVALLIFHLSGSGLGVSGVVIAEIVPVLLLAPLAGALADRLPRVMVMVGADVARAVLAGVLAVWHGDVAVVYAVAFGLSAGSVFFNPAAGSLLPTLVNDGELVAANSGIWSAAVLSQILISPLAGLLTAAAGYGWAFAANAASFAVSALLLRGLRAREIPRPVTAASIWGQAREALSLIGHDQLLRALAVAQMLAALSAGATSGLLVVLAAQRLHATGGGYGLLLAAIAAGAFAGPMLTRLPAGTQRTTIVFAAFGLRGLVDLVLATVTALPAALAALLCYGVGTSTGKRRLLDRHPNARPRPHPRPGVQRIRPDLAIHAPGQSAAGRPARRHRWDPRRLLPRRRAVDRSRAHRADPSAPAFLDRPIGIGEHGRYSPAGALAHWPYWRSHAPPRICAAMALSALGWREANIRRRHPARVTPTNPSPTVTCAVCLAGLPLPSHGGLRAVGLSFPARRPTP